MKGYNRDSVELHSDGPYQKSYPAVNVKCYHFPSAYKIADRFQCSEEIAEQAGEYAFNSACRIFWEDNIPDLIAQYFPGEKYHQSGRSGGWLEVELSDPAGWDGKMLNKWAIFERRVKEDIKYLSSEESIMDSIDSNKWYLPNSREYNFYTTEKGENLCIAEEINKVKENIPPMLQREFGIK